jgi:hypothetical protein
MQAVRGNPTFDIMLVDEDYDTYTFDIELDPGEDAYYTIDSEDLD